MKVKVKERMGWLKNVLDATQRVYQPGLSALGGGLSKHEGKV